MLLPAFQSSPGSGLHRFLAHHQTFARILRALLPSFVADYLFPEHKPTWKLHSTSYLDGLRGIAAFIVFICHFTENNFSYLTKSYGLNGEDKTSSFVQLPYFRVIFSGRPMVHIFFVISGFALSLKPLQALHARNPEKCYTALASSTFRRPFRLFGPCIVSTFIIMCLRQLGYIRKPEESWTLQFRHWRRAVHHQITWPWSWDKDLRPDYDVHLWTIPIEFAHSMLLFIVVLMLSRVRQGIRMAAVFGLILYCMTCGKWAAFEFLSGMLLAEWHILRSACQSDAQKTWENNAPSSTSTSHLLKRTFQTLLLATSLFIAGWPNRDADKTPGIRYFLSQTPRPFAPTVHPLAPQKFWFGLSAIAIVWCIGDIDPLRKAFESPLAQYAGRISYAVYIVHGAVEDLLKARLIGHPGRPAVGEIGSPGWKPAIAGTGVKGLVGVETAGQITVAWVIGLGVMGVWVVWAADVFWRGVDAPMVNFARKVEGVCLEEEGKQKREGSVLPA
ncbi:uncharacterized protein CTHT_0058920 [Thermochaetoides thermophila DSM 1495]|uniref:Acyltransferase 3 domain-containing protein n=1 Tax=Chaetomium thermophilum (strain DSM 1495 / CBS 144.50 / IMI 039719) TaxID=759272 RepID=G0SCZ5_CHATD|nr:hypothetical protein CTHT_0058920 [Thermochaetoides thermophila DSM 1495]EGS19266.1 hypothetical protein CTHT_0058920 [Thermochaetoides thermophila DSM 1495]